MSAFHKLVQRMFKGKPAAVGSTGILSKDGHTTYRNVQEQLKRFVEHFVEVLDVGSLTTEQAALMEEEISSVEEVVWKRAREQQSLQQHRNDMQQPLDRSAKPRADAAAPPSLKEVAEAMTVLKNDAAAGLDDITTPLLKVGHVVIG
ncbi:hypothetical protein R1flu_003477 [Riccia fluitans]|uniref:Uncharacterized protein n=1 Tax=Riccia fluitans TaxID=41844 RepID=A0ABD1YC72_9MARC